MASGNVVVYGAGGHGKVVGDVILAAGMQLIGFVDDQALRGHCVLQNGTERSYSVLGDGTWLRSQSGNFADVALAIGNNKIRSIVADRLLESGFELACLAHPSSSISRFARLGPGCVVMALAAINPNADVGTGTIINTGAVVEHDVAIGEFAHVSPNASLAGGAQLGARSHLGTGAVVLPGVIVGCDCVVGAGAVVNRNVADGSVVVGVPARKIRNAL